MQDSKGVCAIQRKDGAYFRPGDLKIVSDFGEELVQLDLCQELSQPRCTEVRAGVSHFLCSEIWVEVLFITLVITYNQRLWQSLDWHDWILGASRTRKFRNQSQLQSSVLTKLCKIWHRKWQCLKPFLSSEMLTKLLVGVVLEIKCHKHWQSNLKSSCMTLTSN